MEVSHVLNHNHAAGDDHRSPCPPSAMRDLLQEGYLFRAEEGRQIAQEFFAVEQEVWDRQTVWEE